MRRKRIARKRFSRKCSDVARRVTFAALTFALTTFAAPLGIDAQAVIRDVPFGRFFPYGLDDTLVRADSMSVHAHVANEPYLRGYRSTPESDAYVLLRLSVRNPNGHREDVPLFAASTVTRGGKTIDPAVYGPFIAASTTAAPTSATIGPHATIRITLAIANLPDNDPIATVVLNPNDATPAYRIRVILRSSTLRL